MKIAVYGSLKKGYWNSRLLEGSELLAEGMISGYKLYNSGFPVATPSEGTKITVEVYEVDEKTLAALDRLEGNGSMYNRTDAVAHVGEDAEIQCQVYVGGPRWSFNHMEECKSRDGIYTWDGR